MIVRSLAVLALLGASLVAQQPATAVAQDKAPADAEAIFYKAFYLDRGASQRAEAIALYKQFIEKAPTHQYAKRAASYTINLLNAEGKTDEVAQFKAKYPTLVNASDTGDAAAQPAAARGGDRAPGAGRPEGAPQGRGPGGGGAARLETLKADLAKAKEAKDDAKVADLEKQIKDMEARIAQRGQGGQPGGNRGGFAVMGMKITEMTDEQLEQFKTGLDGRMITGQVERMRDNGQADEADKLEKNVAKVKALLKEGKKEEAEKIRAEIMQNMTQRRGRGGN